MRRWLPAARRSRGQLCNRGERDEARQMKTVLLTAFEPYDQWATNASWLALVELARDLPERPRIVTRRYPVDFALLRERLAADLQGNYDYALHLGQAPGTSRLRLEAVGLNFGAERDRRQNRWSRTDRSPIGPLCRWTSGRRSSTRREFPPTSRIMPAHICATRRCI